MTRLMNRRPGREGQLFLAALPFALVILAYLAASAARHPTAEWVACPRLRQGCIGLEQPAVIDRTALRRSGLAPFLRLLPT